MCAELLFPPAGSPRFRSGRIHGCRRTTRRRSAPGALRSFPVARLRGGQSSSPPPFPAGHGQPPGKPGGPTPIPETDSPDTGIRLAPERPGAEPFCSAHPAARFSLARCLRRSVPVPRRLSEAPGPCARIRRKRKAPPPSVSEGGGVSVCGFFIARACRGSLFPR